LPAAPAVAGRAATATLAASRRTSLHRGVLIRVSLVAVFAEIKQRIHHHRRGRCPSSPATTTATTTTATATTAAVAVAVDTHHRTEVESMRHAPCRKAILLQV
jgi:hypothetical protein